MAVYKLTIYVEDISEVIALFDVIRVYRSITGNEADRVLYSTVSLVASQTTYEYYDTSAVATYAAWFTYYNSSTLVESDFSTSIVYGTGAEEWAPSFSFSPTTYPEEFGLDSTEIDIVNSIRIQIGDGKIVVRDYVNPQCESLYSNVYNDGTTYKLSDPPGWPLKVIKDNVEYTSLTDPTVNGYEYLTFTGSVISTVTGVLDVWYEKFRHSDREILYTYYNTDIPSPLTTSTVTTEIKKVAAAVALLESEIRDLMGRVDGSFSVAGDTRFDPNPILRAKNEDLEKLRKKLQDLVDSTSYYGIYGVTGVRLE